MKATYKWRITNNKYAYIIDDGLKDAAFIYNTLTSERTYKNKVEVVSGIFDNDVKNIVIGYNEETYKTKFELLLKLLKEDNDGKLLHLLDYTAYFNEELDDCSEDATEVECNPTDVIINAHVTNVSYNEKADVDVIKDSSYDPSTKTKTDTFNLKFYLPEPKNGKSTIINNYNLTYTSETKCYFNTESGILNEGDTYIDGNSARYFLVTDITENEDNTSTYNLKLNGKLNTTPAVDMDISTDNVFNSLYENKDSNGNSIYYYNSKIQFNKNTNTLNNTVTGTENNLIPFVVNGYDGVTITTRNGRDIILKPDTTGKVQIWSQVDILSTGLNVTGSTKFEGDAIFVNNNNLNIYAKLNTTGLSINNIYPINGSEKITLHNNIEIEKNIKACNGHFLVTDDGTTNTLLLKNENNDTIFKVSDEKLYYIGVTELSGSTKILAGGLNVSGNTALNGGTKINGGLTIESGGLSVTGDTKIGIYSGSNLSVGGGVNIGSVTHDGLNVTGTTNLSGKTNINTGGLSVTGNTSVTGNITGTVNGIPGVYIGCPIGTIVMWPAYASDLTKNCPDGWKCCSGEWIYVRLYREGDDDGYDFEDTIKNKWIASDSSYRTICKILQCTYCSGTVPETNSSTSDDNYKRYIRTPNFHGKFPIGCAYEKNNESTEINNGYDSSGNKETANIKIGKTGGSGEVKLSINTIPSHTHLRPRMHKCGYTGGTSSNGMSYDSELNANLEATSPTGVGNSHSNMPPYLAIEFIIKCY